MPRFRRLAEGKNPAEIKIKTKPVEIKRTGVLATQISRLQKAAESMRKKEMKEMQQRLKQGKPITASIKRLKQIDEKLNYLTESRIEQTKTRLERDPKFTTFYNDPRFAEMARTRLVHPANHSIAMVDIDFFKKVNDKYGHGIGDKILRIYSEAFQGICRKYKGFAGRHGGEEIGVYLPLRRNETTEVLHEVSVEIEKKFTADPELVRKMKKSPTFSAGISTVEGKGDYGRMMDHADVLLYVSKDKGRNRMTTHFSRKNTTIKIKP